VVHKARVYQQHLLEIHILELKLQHKAQEVFNERFQVTASMEMGSHRQQKNDYKLPPPFASQTTKLREI